MNVYIEGNIGSGKSTFVDLLKSYISKIDMNGKFQTHLIQEPVGEWLKTFDADGKNILEKFYEDQDRWSFTFQMNSFISRAHLIQEVRDAASASASSAEPLLLVERSIYTDRHCFARNCFESGKMTKLEYDVYCRWNDWLSEQFALRPKAYIYLRCPPEENVIRIAKRSREGECGIPLEYLKQLHQMHDGWMAQEKCTIPVLTIDATRNFLDPEVMDDIFAELDTFIHGLE
jgi:deoxyadenosine/deoxycytidine kinase